MPQHHPPLSAKLEFIMCPRVRAHEGLWFRFSVMGEVWLHVHKISTVDVFPSLFIRSHDFDLSVGMRSSIYFRPLRRLPALHNIVQSNKSSRPLSITAKTLFHVL